MSLLDSVRARGRHRGKSGLELLAVIARVERERDAARAETRQTAFQLGIYVAAHNEAEYHAAAAEDEAIRLKTETDQQAEEQARELETMKAELTALRQFKANVCSTDVEPMVRDASGDGLDTPIPEPVYGKHTGVWPLHQAPLADTQPTPTLRLEFPHGGQVIRASGDHRATA